MIPAIVAILYSLGACLLLVPVLFTIALCRAASDFSFFELPKPSRGGTATVKFGGSETGINRVRGISLLLRSERLPGSRDCNSGSKSKIAGFGNGQVRGKTGYVTPEDSRQVSRLTLPQLLALSQMVRRV